MVKKNVEPCPNSDSTPILPPRRCVMRSQIASPCRCLGTRQPYEDAKPASARYHGTLNFLFRDSRINARNPFADARPEEQRRIFEGSFTGPLGHGRKTSFLITADHEQDDLQAVVFASGPTAIIRENVPN